MSGAYDSWGQSVPEVHVAAAGDMAHWVGGQVVIQMAAVVGGNGGDGGGGGISGGFLWHEPRVRRLEARQFLRQPVTARDLFVTRLAKLAGIMVPTRPAHGVEEPTIEKPKPRRFKRRIR